MIEILDELGKHLVIRDKEGEWARYVYGTTGIWKPYLHPVLAPNGTVLTENAPVDHRNHHGIWFGYARAGDMDWWQERSGFGRIRHREFEGLQKENSAQFSETSEWVNSDSAVRLVDRRIFTFSQAPNGSRLIDINYEMLPSGRPVCLYPTKEAGLPMVRVADALDAKDGGQIINSENQHKEAGTYGKRARWLAVSGKSGKREAGIALMDHPENPDHPTYWFVRDYGAFAPNNPLFTDEITISPERALRYRYRIVAFDGPADPEELNRVFDEYADSKQRSKVEIQDSP